MRAARSGRRFSSNRAGRCCDDDGDQAKLASWKKPAHAWRALDTFNVFYQHPKSIRKTFKKSLTVPFKNLAAAAAVLQNRRDPI